jgi:two-component system, cell cycle response regulator CtrA
MHVLLIEDNNAVAEMIKLLLAGKGFNIAVADCGEDGIDLAKRYNYDIIILDLQLPDISGLQVLRTLRSSAIVTPVMVLSGNMVVDAKVKALGIGADDYLTKPFHKDELIARIHAVVRRSQGHSQTVIATGKLSVNLDSRTVEAKGVRVPVTAREYQILELLSLRKGATLSKDLLMDHLYGGMDEPEAKIIDVFICKLRKKLATVCDGEQYIQTVWGSGYRFDDTAMKTAA